MKKRTLPIVFTVASFVWAIFIFSNSLQTGESSGQLSGSATELINRIIGSVFPTVEVSHLFVRKSAHFCEFALMSLLVSFAIYFFARESKRRELLCLIAIPVSALIGACDETIQLFVEGRGASVIDVMIDTSGGATAALIFLGITLLIRFHRQKKTKDS